MRTKGFLLESGSSKALASLIQFHSCEKILSNGLHFHKWQIAAESCSLDKNEAESRTTYKEPMVGYIQNYTNNLHKQMY